LLQSQKKRIDLSFDFLKSALAVGFLLLIVSGKSVGQEKAVKELVKYNGRALAFVDSTASGAGVGPKFQQFVFSISRSDEPANPISVRVVYEYFKPAEKLGKDFLTSGKTFQLDLFRKRSCDDSVLNFGYESDGDERVKILKPLPGVENELIAEESVLPCFVLRPGKIKVIR
jgi:hypothetical protein